MKKVSRLIALSLVFSFSILMLTLPARAEVVFNDLVPFSQVVVINCDGTTTDVVDLSGELHILVSQTTNNNIVRMKTQYVPRNVTGTGTISGATYRGVGLTTDTSTVVFDGPTVLTFVNNFYIIGQDGGTRYLVHQVFHTTIDADGNVVVDHDNAFISCPGN